MAYRVDQVVLVAFLPNPGADMDREEEHASSPEGYAVGYELDRVPAYLLLQGVHHWEGHQSVHRTVPSSFVIHAPARSTFVDPDKFNGYLELRWLCVTQVREGRSDLQPNQRRQDKRDAAAENLKGHTFGPATTTKNPKKLRKQKAMGELGEGVTFSEAELERIQQIVDSWES